MKLKEITDFQKLVVERYSVGATATYEEKGDFSCLFYAPMQYENEDKMLAYALKNPTLTARELSAYWDSITPDGLPPCASEWDEDED